MWKNYLKTAFRNIRSNPLFSLLNILGLATGITIASLLLLYVQNERSFDRSHEKIESIQRVIVNADLGEEVMTWANAPNAVGPTALENIPGIQNQVRMLKHNFGDLAFVQYEDQTFTEDQFYWVDSSIAEVFTVNVLAGQRENILDEPNQVMICKSVSDRIFKGENPIGKKLSIDQQYDLEITGVYEDFPQNSSLDAEMLGSFASTNFSKRLSWSNSSFETYLLLHPDSDPAEITLALEEMVAANNEGDGRWYTLSLQELADVHLGSADISSSYTSRLGDPRQLKLLFYLAIVVLLIASINYMNLSTARSEQRAKEVAINKTIGANRASIMTRFYMETAILVTLAVIVSLVFLSMGMPYFNILADKSFLVSDLFTSSFMVPMGLIASTIIVLSGAYPALYLSAFSPASLFGKQSGGHSLSALVFRKGLVVLQFAASLIIIVATLAFYRQLQFIQDKNLGYAPEQVVAISTAGAKGNTEVTAFVNRIKNMPQVASAARAQTFPGEDASGRTLTKPLDPTKSIILQSCRVDADYIETLSLELIAGRTLPKDGMANDSVVQVVLNEQAVEFLGYSPEEAIGKEAPGLFWQKYSEIVGVVKDFHFETFHRPIGAYVLHNNPSEWRNYTLVKLGDGNLRASMQALESAFRSTIPNSAFEFTFLDDHLDKLYRSEDRTARIFMLFGGISIFIACLGLFGLTAYKAEQRKKEIGIRKVLGANVPNIVYLLSREFLVLVIIALVVAIPLAWYFISQWMDNFAYADGISVGPFVVAGVVSILVALLTTGLQSVRAATTDPIDAIRADQ